MMKGAAACHLSLQHGLTGGDKVCTSSTVTLVISRNARGTGGPCTGHQPARGPPCLGGLVDH